MAHRAVPREIRVPGRAYRCGADTGARDKAAWRYHYGKRLRELDRAHEAQPRI
jgi:hypothetical protein